PSHAARGIRAIEFGHLVENLAIVYQGDEAVCAAFGNVERLAIFSGELYADPIAKRGRAIAQIKHHVVDCTLGTADQLGFLVRCDLIVNSPQRSLALVEGNAALHELRVERVLFELFAAPCARKKAALIMLAVRINFKDTVKLSLLKNHGLRL